MERTSIREGLGRRAGAEFAGPVAEAAKARRFAAVTRGISGSRAAPTGCTCGALRSVSRSDRARIHSTQWARRASSSSSSSSLSPSRNPRLRPRPVRDQAAPTP